MNSAGLKIELPNGIKEQNIPHQVDPMMALYSGLPANEDNYAFEYKWDGVRTIYFWDGINHRLQSRNLLDISISYPELDALAQHFPDTKVVLDGEIIAIDEHGKASFNLLQHRFGIYDPKEARKRAIHIPAVYMIFDILYFDKYSTMQVIYSQRRKLLESLELNDKHWQVPPLSIGHGHAMLEAAAELHLEGVIAKRLNSFYEPGRRSGAWIKTKLVLSQEFVVGGWTTFKGDHLDMLGALLLGYYEGERLIYAGAVGTGFTDADRRTIVETLSPIRRNASPFATPAARTDAIWVEPVVVAQIEFRGWTAQDILRQPSFKGFRFDKDAKDVIKEIKLKG